MNTIFNQNTVDELIGRIHQLQDKHTASWGKMTAYQMVKHCILSEEMYLGKKQYNRLFIGRLFGKMALRSIVKNESPMAKNAPTHPEFKNLVEQGNIEEIKPSWIALLQEYREAKPQIFQDFIHPFFGKMNREQIGVYVFKHTDHHLRQFGV